MKYQSLKETIDKQYYSMRQLDHYNATYNYYQDKIPHLQLQKPQSLNTTGQQRSKMAQTSSNATHYGGGQAPMDIDAIHKGTGKYKESTKEKERTKENATEDTTTMDTTATKEKDKEENTIQLDKAIPFQEKDSNIFSSKEATTTTKEKAKER